MFELTNFALLVELEYDFHAVCFGFYIVNVSFEVESFCGNFNSLSVPLETSSLVLHLYWFSKI